MTRGIYLSTATDEIYSSEAFDYIARFENVFTDLAALTGISPAAIASAMAEERSAFDWKDEGLDIYAKSAVNPSNAVADLPLAIAGGQAGMAAWLATNAVQLALSRTHEEWMTDYQAVHDYTAAPSEIDKILHPTLIDAGPANFKIKTAIDLVNDYADDYPDLQLGVYLNDYALLVDHLINPNNPLTAKLWALYLKEAESWFTSPVVHSYHTH